MKFSFLGHMKEMLRELPIVATYLSLWFCAITFYNQAAVHMPEKGIESYGIAVIQALVMSKIMLTAEMIVPVGVIFKPNVKFTIYLAILVRTTLASIVALMLRYSAAGTEGFFKHQGFIESMRNFCDGDIAHILALTCLYWLIVLPYIAYRFLLHLAGNNDLASYLLEKRPQN
ncbi:hypothetical protein [Polynucleobacter sp. MWH-Adler-W8]|jgi:hypothetical protein|uniref:hypothetical protein n=1 Tax=Polynucleobacter sp. MWH-Adler-W8 TaxID=1819727 RepID=UPI000B2D97B9|nr:hypothetical protein [Polynucleobacter sp. MWH-Adler-W8]